MEKNKENQNKQRVCQDPPKGVVWGVLNGFLVHETNKTTPFGGSWCVCVCFCLFVVFINLSPFTIMLIQLTILSDIRCNFGRLIHDVHGNTHSACKLCFFLFVMFVVYAASNVFLIRM